MIKTIDVDNELEMWVAETGPHTIDQISARIAKRWVDNDAGYVRIRLATGADGKTDIRLEFETTTGIIAVRRWRPELGARIDLDDVVQSGTTRRIARSEASRLLRESMLDAALGDPVAMVPESVREAYSTVGARLHELRDISEAKLERSEDISAIVSETESLAIRMGELRTRIDAENVARKAVR